MRPGAENVNLILGKLAINKGLRCVKCNHEGLPGELNLEGRIHHNVPATCLDLKACRRRQRKQDRRKGR